MTYREVRDACVAAFPPPVSVRDAIASHFAAQGDDGADLKAEASGSTTRMFKWLKRHL